VLCRMTGIICPFTNENGYCDSTACHNMTVVGNSKPKERSENISNRVKPQSHWHKGAPTEEDVKDIDEDNAYCFAICVFYDKWWLSDYLFKANIKEGCFEAETAHDGILKIPFSYNYPWQKIEPYEED